MVRIKSKWTQCNQGHNHQSKREAFRCNDLALLEKAGKIRGVQHQPRFLLQPSFHFGKKVIRAVVYVADFQYWDIDKDVEVIEDCKGHKTQLYKLKKKLLLFQKRDDPYWEFRES